MATAMDMAMVTATVMDMADMEDALEAVMEKKTENKNFRQVDTKEYLSMLRELTEQGENVNVLITGNSMSPFLIHLRDQIYFEKPKRTLKKGDIVFYQRRNGQFIMHRICKIDKTGYYMVGDAQIDIEGPLEREQIFGLVTAVKRKGKIERPGTFWWEFFEHIWLLCIPLRPYIQRGYGRIKKILGR